MNEPALRVSSRGAERWRAGHPWIYRSDVADVRMQPGVVRVVDGRGRFLGRALFSPSSEIRLRLLTTEDIPIDTQWWEARLRLAVARRANLEPPATAFRIVHAEADGLPSLVIDRYGDVVVAQMLSAGLEAVRADMIAAIEATLSPGALLLRNDASVRRHERLPLSVEEIHGPVPDFVTVRESHITWEADLRTGQKTGAFLDQRENRALAGRLARGRALDCFCYEGLFALHMSRQARDVLAIDQSEPALARAERNAARNGLSNVRFEQGNVFDVLRELDRKGERFDTIVLDPPAFAKTRGAAPKALRGYHEINQRALRLLNPGGHLITASCSFHVSRSGFLEMLRGAAADSGRRVTLVRVLGQPADHPEVLTIPETGYLKGAVVRASE